jgi:two-component system OmpR family response regulator
MTRTATTPKTHVVLVEDSREIGAVVEQIMADAGPYEVVARIATENEGTQWLQDGTHHWDVAVIDLVLREGSGFNLVRRYREAHEKGKILVLSDYATTNIKIRCVEFGADAAFTKGEFKAFADYLSRMKPMAH